MGLSLLPVLLLPVSVLLLVVPLVPKAGAGDGAGGEKGTSASKCDENQVTMHRREDRGQAKGEEGKRKKRMDR